MNEKINGMRESNKILVDIFNDLYDYICQSDNITTNDIDLFCYQRMCKYNCVSAAYNYPGEVCNFPKYVCVSVNEQVCHGVANDYVVKIGDIVSVDICIKYNQYYADSCVSFIYKKALNENDARLVKAGYETMIQTIQMIKPGISIGDLSYNMEKIAKKYGYNVIRDFAGHFIGKSLHIDPLIPFYGKQNTGYKLKPGDCFTIEPMVIDGPADLDILADGWTAISMSGKKSCQFEHTVLVTNIGYEILTHNDKYTKFIW